MKKKLFKLFSPLVLLIVFTSKVNASLSCNVSGGDTTIKETDINSAGFQAKMPYCEWDGPEGYKPSGKKYETYKEAFDSGLETERVYVESLDGKGLVGTSVPRCGDSKRKVEAVVSCSKNASLTENTCSIFKSKGKCNNSSGCSWSSETDDGSGECTGNNSHYYCGNGLTLNKSDNKCYYTYTLDDAKGKNPIKLARKTFGQGGKCTAEYELQCPYYKCERKYGNFSLCAPEFKINGQPAYCVNPSQGFQKNNNNYQYDETFNVLNCSNSYSTVDCGYANILIEGAYYDTSDDAINTALRLWSVHSGQAGFDTKTGVANLTGKNCDNITYFPTDENGKYVNVYNQTYEYIMTNFYAKAKQYSHIPEVTSCYSKGPSERLIGNTFKEIACSQTTDSEMKGVMCGPNKDYRVAFELYFNTLIGNKCMKEHLSQLYNGGEGVKPTAAVIQSEYVLEEETNSSSTESWVEVSFEHEAFWNEIKDEEVDCNKLDELKQKLIDEGKSKSEAEAIINEIEPYCKVTYEIVGPDGKVLSEGDMDYCIKNSGCRTNKFNFAVCDIVEKVGKDIEIVVKYERAKSSYSVRKYYACANPNANQTLFAFFDEESLSGSGSNNSNKVDESITEKTFSVTNYKCSGGCDNANLRTEGNTTCSNNQENYNGVYNSKVKDPSLRCIANMSNSADKSKYDYSDYFGINTNFCRVYCSDEVEYIIADKVKAISGRTFMYNIEFPAKSTNELNYLLTSVVKEKRSCMSEIYYSHLDDLNKLRDDYDLTDAEFKKLKESKTFAGLYGILKSKAEKENNREEVLNQIIYDIYNCNFYNNEQISEKGVDVPKNYPMSLTEKINSIYNKDNYYGLGSDINGKKTTNDNKSAVKYGFGALIKDSDNRVDNVANGSEFTGSLSSVSYCSDENGSLCYGYDSNKDDESYNYPTNNESTPKTYKLFTKNVDVPTNDYARFEVTAEINFYNNNKYQVEYGTGKVLLGNNNSELLTLPNYSYPIDKNAYNLSACQIKDENGNLIENGLYHRCSVTQNISPMTFYRKTSAGKLATESDNKFTCYVDVEQPACSDPSKDNCDESSAAIYRNVDPANLFPSGNNKNGSNWKTIEGMIAKEEIESSADDLKINDEHLDYSISLTPTQIKSIKEYNKQYGVYSEELIYKCDKKKEEGYYFDCHSYFLDVLRGNSAEYSSGMYGNIIVDKYN